jgi:outer membrane protein OmpA-like peptidoglycan-associated protein
MPARLVFEAVRANNSPIALKGQVPAAAAAAYFGVIAGRVPTDALVVGPGLPENFITNAIAGIEALMRLNEGRLGFDGTQWYVRGKAEGAALKDAIMAAIDAVPMRGDWDVGITVLSPLDICRNRVGQLEARNVILFQSGSAKLTPDSEAPLDELAADLAICPDTDVHVEGHTDADGPDDVNLILSIARAEAVVAALVERGTAEDRLYAEGYGEFEPVATNDTRQGKQQNRRIAFTIAPR